MNSPIKECPYCREKIKADALKCRYCGEFLNKFSDTEITKTTTFALSDESSHIKSQPQQGKSQSSKVVSIIVGIIFFIFAYVVVQQLFPPAQSVSSSLVTAASEANKSLPMMVDSETRLDNTIALSGNTFQYNYTLINTTINSVNPQELKDYISPTIINGVKTNPALESFRTNKVTFIYSYKDMNGYFLFDVKVIPSQYK